MKIQNTKQFYNKLLIKKYEKNVDLFLNDICSIESIFWDCCRDFSKEILRKNESWRWLSFRVDDFAINIERNMIKKLEKWSKKGSLSKIIQCLESTINWLFDRYVNLLKNLFDPRYLTHLKTSHIIDIDDCEIIENSEIEKEIILTDFAKFNESKKTIILKKVWDESSFDIDFNICDMQNLCKKYGAPPPESFLDLSYEKNYKLEQAKNGHSQLVFVFE